MAEIVTKEKVYSPPKTRAAEPIAHCPGCHYGIIIRLVCEAFEELKIDDKVILLPGVGCSYMWPRFIDVDSVPCPHGRAPAMGTALKRIHPDAIVVTVQGDGDLGAIGLGCFMNALSRGEKLTTIFLNNARRDERMGIIAHNAGCLRILLWVHIALIIVGCLATIIFLSLGGLATIAGLWGQT